jgi:hypothetical protein
VEGTLTGTVPTDCTITFTPTIARTGTTVLTISATDDFAPTCDDCEVGACPTDCVTCPTQYQVVLSGFPDSTMGVDYGGDYCCRRWNQLNGIYTLTRAASLPSWPIGTCGWGWEGYNGLPEEPCNRWLLRLVCEDLHWLLQVSGWRYNSSYWRFYYQAPILTSCPPNGVYPWFFCAPINMTSGECIGWNCAGNVSVCTVTAL